MKGAILGYAGILAILVIGIFFIAFVENKGPVSATVASKEGVLTSFENFNHLFLKTFREGVNFISQRAAYDLGKNGGSEDSYVLWTSGTPSLETLRINVRNRIIDNMPVTYFVGNRKVIVDNITLDVQMSDNFFFVNGWANFTIYDESIDTRTMIGEEMNYPISSNYFKLAKAARVMMEEARFTSHFNDAGALVNALYAAKAGNDPLFVGLNFSEVHNSNSVNVTILEKCFPRTADVYCLSPLNPGETGIKDASFVDVPYDYTKIVVRFLADQTDYTPPTFDFALSLRPSSGRLPGVCPAVCGDGAREGAEECDGIDLNSKSCAALGFTAGALACKSDCTFDTSGCSKCNNGVREIGEECDGSDFGGKTCQTYGFTGGSLTCTGCVITTGSCTSPPVSTCHNPIGTINPGEDCDGTNLNLKNCTTIPGGFNGGILSCNAVCKFDTSKCTLPAPPTACPNKCENGKEYRGGSGSPCTYSSVKTCRYGCKPNSADCWEGVACSFATAKCKNCDWGTCGTNSCSGGGSTCYNTTERVPKILCENWCSCAGMGGWNLLSYIRVVTDCNNCTSPPLCTFAPGGICPPQTLVSIEPNCKTENNGCEWASSSYDGGCQISNCARTDTCTYQ